MPIATPTNSHLYVEGTGHVLVKWKEINATIIGDNEIVPAVTNKRIRVIAVDMKATLALSLTVKSGPNPKIGATALIANERVTFVAIHGFWVETNPGEALVFNQTALGMQGILNYVEVN